MSSYDANARVPVVGSRWYWRDQSLIEVIEVIWNGEEWWVRTKRLVRYTEGIPPPYEWDPIALNDLANFTEACSPALPRMKRWTHHDVREGEEWSIGRRIEVGAAHQEWER